MNKKGFTMVELLLVISIIGIISVIAIPNILDALKRNKEESYNEYVSYLKNNLEMYAIDLKEDLWTNANKDSVVEVDFDTLKSRSKDLSLNDKCVVVDPMKIKKEGNDFTYYVCVYCEKIDEEKAGNLYKDNYYFYKAPDCVVINDIKN